jgi:hypothetical protein
MSFRLSRQCRVVKPPLRCADVTLGAAIHSGVTSTRTCRVRRRAFRGPEPGMSASQGSTIPRETPGIVYYTYLYFIMY